MLHLIKYAIYTKWTKSLYSILGLPLQFPSWHVRTSAEIVKLFFIQVSYTYMEQDLTL